MWALLAVVFGGPSTFRTTGRGVLCLVRCWWIHGALRMVRFDVVLNKVRVVGFVLATLVGVH